MRAALLLAAIFSCALASTPVTCTFTASDPSSGKKFTYDLSPMFRDENDQSALYQGSFPSGDSTFRINVCGSASR